MRFLTTAVIAAAFVAALQAQTVHVPGLFLSVVTDGLNNPQGVTVGPGGEIYVADSGNGQVLRSTGGDVFTPFITDITISDFGGLLIGPLGVHAVADGTLIYNEGGRPTGVEQVHHHAADGSLIRSLPAVPGGGNWTDSAIAPDGRLFSSSTNGDLLFAADPDGNTWGTFSEFANTGASGLIAPTGIVFERTTMFVGFFGRTGGSIAQYTLTGTLLNPSWSTGFDAVTAIAQYDDGDLLVADFGDFPVGDIDPEGTGTLWRVDRISREKTLLVSGLQHANGIAFESDGSILISENGNFNQGNGRLLRLAIPEPATAWLTVALLMTAVRRRGR